MPDTLGSMKAEVVDWLGGENVSTSKLAAAINDAVDALWSALILAAIQVFVGGPTTISFSAGDERTTIVTIADPAAGPAISNVVSGNPALAVHTVRAAVTYVTESGTETLGSPETSFTTALGDIAAVHFPAIVAGAIGWNVYASSTATGALVKQNAEPLDWSAYYNEPDAGFTEYPNGPIVPTENTTGDSIFYIRHLEYKTSSGMYQSYNAGDLDSDFVRRLAGSIAATSEYQNYAWDLINQRQLEIRPAVGLAFSPRYFYIVKPRRMRFDQAALPFPTIPSTEFIRTYALSLIFLSLHEYDASEAWERKSDKALGKAVRALTQMNTNRNDRVTPFSIG